jgi:hypothetical protein
VIVDIMPTAAERCAAIAEELSAATYVFTAAADDVGLAADEVARLDRDYRAALAQTGRHDVRPSPRELAAELLHGRVQSLHPFVPFQTGDAAERAGRELEDWAPPELSP